MDTTFQDSRNRVGTRMRLQNACCNLRNLLIPQQKVLIAVLLTTVVAIGLVVIVIKKLTLDDCLGSERCQNGGTCVNDIHGHICVCAQGYEGEECANVKNNCSRGEPCLNGGTCVNEINSYSCACAVGFSGNVCENVVECRYPGTCASRINPGNCVRCRDGFVKDPEDNTRCNYANGNASLIISSTAAIEKISLDLQKETKTIQNGESARGTDYSFPNDTIFWFSFRDKKIYRAAINRESDKNTILQDTSSHISGLAVDWIYQHLYWVDSKRNQLCVSNFDGTMKKVFFNDGLDWPQSIAVNPLNGWIYWTDKSKDCIERAGLDGSRREVILRTNITKPHGIAVDLEDNRIFWSQDEDPSPSSIWSSDFDGSNRKLILTANPPHFYSSIVWKVVTFDDYVYFIESFSKTVYRVNKCNGNEVKVIYKAENNLQDLKIYSATLQPEGENVCSKRIELCSHFCFPVPSLGNGSVPTTTTTCACPDGLSLMDDQRNCA